MPRWPLPFPEVTVRLLCDGQPVTIQPEDWFENDDMTGCDYTVDATGARHWCQWPSPRFSNRPEDLTP